jgi:hypothetical protein
MLSRSSSLIVPGWQATDAYANDATVKEYNKGLTLMKAGYTIYLACIALYLFMVVSGTVLNRMNFGRPARTRSTTFVSPPPPPS